MTKQSHCIAGSVAAGCFSTLLGHPLDTIKVYQQTNPHPRRSSSALDAARLLARGDVLRLFRGIGPPMANQIVMNSVMFAAFDEAKDAANASALLGENSAALVAGLFSGFATACVSTPADWFKIQAQVSLSGRGDAKEGARHDAMSILRRNAWKDGKFRASFFAKTLYSGHAANLGREGAFTMVYLGLYDRIRDAVGARRRRENDADARDRPLDMGTVALISSFTGACAWMCNCPFDAVKTAMQAGGASSALRRHERIALRCAIRSIYESGGWKAFWRGAGPSTFRAMLVTSSRMLAYEKTIQMLGRRSNDES